MTSAEIEVAYNSETTARLRELFKDIYTPEEFGMYLALPNILFGGKSELEMIHEGRDEECLQIARQLTDGAYT